MVELDANIYSDWRNRITAFFRSIGLDFRDRIVDLLELYQKDSFRVYAFIESFL